MIADNFEEKVLNGEELSKDELSFLIHDYEVETEFGENRRWSRGATTISEVQGRFFMTSWENGLTEYQDNEYYDQPTEVQKVTTEKTITVTEWQPIISPVLN